MRIYSKNIFGQIKRAHFRFKEFPRRFASVFIKLLKIIEFYSKVFKLILIFALLASIGVRILVLYQHESLK
ncbi:hypothetical protein C1646_692023 [Rhizophagus diaphanus]|nr:hypothetical protein C1646_692023 [Rhizophagus diaphanus] [Rhizophagus sp. MUCL 43196]